MTNKPIKILIIEDSDDDECIIIHTLQSEGGFKIDYKRVESANDMQTALETEHWDLILADYTMPHFSGPSALRILQESGQDIPFIIVSGSIGEETAVEAMKAGAHDYIMKGNLRRLIPAVVRELRESEVRAARKRAEEELRTTERLRMAGEMTASIIHDLKGPMQIITSMNEFLDENNLSKEQRAKHCQIIDEQIQRMAYLTRKLLDFARGELEINRTPVDLPALCREVHDTYKEVMARLGIDLTFISRKETGISPMLMLDKGRIRRSIVNLIDNARDAMPEGGELRIKLMINQSSASLEIEDTGRGIPDKIRDRIFKPFVTSGKFNGTGLGLAIVNEIVESHGGRIDVVSTTNIGTAFIITLPRIEAAENFNHDHEMTEIEKE
jgi:signal transduction histidine kinase